jgi:hypothetical protein
LEEGKKRKKKERDEKEDKNGRVKQKTDEYVGRLGIYNDTYNKYKIRKLEAEVMTEWCMVDDV